MGTQVIDNLRRTGITFIDDIPWGTHICGFYETKNDLIDIIVPYFKAGLESNEFCMWIVSEPLNDAVNTLESIIPNYKSYSSQMEILSDVEWYTRNGAFQGEAVLEGWVKKVDYALAQGYEGIRVCGSTNWLKKRLWKSFMDYEAIIEREIGTLKMIALCPYQLDMCGFHEVLDVVRNHQFAFIKSKYDWKYSRTIAKFDRLDLVAC